jgi:hypothetical protein
LEPDNSHWRLAFVFVEKKSVAGGDERVILVGDVVRDGVHETLWLRHVLFHCALVPQFVRGPIVMRTELPDVDAVLFD